MKKFSIVAVLKNGKIAYEFAESKADIEQKLAEYRTAGITMLISSMLPFKAVATPAKIDYVIVTDLKTGESYGRFEDGFGDRTEKKSEEPKTAAGNFTEG